MAEAYARRIVDDELDELLTSLPAISIEGAKGVGKTAAARQRANTEYDLDRPGVLQTLQADPARVISGAEPILIDEWQRLPASWDLVRRAVDQQASPARFLLTGSASRDDISTHSGAARIVRVRMRPLSLAERGFLPTVSLSELLTGRRGAVTGSTDRTVTDYVDEIVNSGLPGIRHLPPRALRSQLDGYVDGIIDRDFVELSRPTRNPAALRRWLGAYAAASSTTATWEAVRDAASRGHSDKPARSTTQPYRDVLERLWILDPVPAWLPERNYLKELGAAPKHNLVDPALAARLLGADQDALLDGRPADSPASRSGTLLGALFESLMALSLRVYAQSAEARVAHLRTHRGEREVDFIVQRADHRVVAIEIKLAHSVDDDDVRQLRWLADRLGPDLLDSVVITTGPDAYRRSDGIAVIPAALLGP